MSYKINYDNSLSKTYKWILFILLSLLFKNKLESLVETILINPFLGFVESDYLNDLIFSALIILIIAWYYQKWKVKFIYSKTHLFITASFLLLVLLYRIFPGDWEWIALKSISSIKYADILFIPPILSWLIFLTNRRKSKKAFLKAKETFAVDKPIDKSTEDNLNMKIYAEEIAMRIQALKTEKSFAIGITGAYGSGKTSFMQLIKEILLIDSENYILIDFNPWMSRNESSIIEDFFDHISEELQKYTTSTFSSINKYSRRLSEIDSSIIGKSINILNNSINAENSLTELFSQVNTIFKRVGKKVIIFIDDIDRLTYVEIFEILKLIRTTADFHNVTFIASYDRNYVISAIRSSINQHSEYFLEKIFQVEFTLPYFEKSNLIKNLKVKLLKLTNDKFYKHEIEEYVNSREIDSNIFLSDYITNMRDITRLYNNLLIDYNLLKGEIEFQDLFQIELIKLKFPTVYELLFDSTYEIFENKNGNEGQNLKLIETYDNNNQKFNFPLKNILSSNKDYYCVTENQIEKIIKFVKSIFNDRDWSFGFRDKPHLSIRSRSHFHTYNAFKVLENNISEVEYQVARNGSLNEFCVGIKNWVNNGHRYPLIFRLKQEKEFNSTEEFEKIILAIFYLTKQEAEFENKSINISYDERDLLDKLYGIDSISRKFYNNNTEKFKNFIRSLLVNPSDPYLFESSFIFTIIKHEYEFVIEREELEIIRLSYLQRYLNETIDFKYAWPFHRYCDNIKRLSTGNSSYRIEEIINPKANEILIQSLNNNGLDWFLLEVITTGRMEPDAKVMISKTVTDIFGSMEKFEIFLNSIDEAKWKYLNEFKALYSKCKETGFDKPVEFEFKIMPDKRIKII